MESSVWQAVRFEQIMPVGRTRPILLECVRGTSARRERARFVTKAIGLPEVQAFSLAQELLGVRLARAYGLAAPMAELVMLSPGFLTAAEADLQAASLQISPGVAVGVEFIPDLLPFPVPVRLADDEMSQAAAVYVFDLLIHNPDRSLRSPNCGRAGNTIVPYDFETAFSFRFAVPRTDPWRVGRLPFAKNHVFYDALKGAAVDWPRVFSRFRAVTKTSVSDVCSTIPKAWADVGQDVLAHIAAVIDHWPQFELEIATSLRKFP